VFFGLLEFFFAELLALGFNQILEALGESAIADFGFWADVAMAEPFLERASLLLV
jgi:hypothetical protein